jgi:hypothetical protein
MPIPICKDRNQLGGLLSITGHSTEPYSTYSCCL